MGEGGELLLYSFLSPHHPHMQAHPDSMVASCLDCYIILVTREKENSVGPPS